MEGLCHCGGPQLCAGVTLGFSSNHLRLPPWNLHIHNIKLPAGSVCAWSLTQHVSGVLWSSGRIHCLSFLLQVYLYSCGPWLWLANLEMAITPQSETLPLRKWWRQVSIIDIHNLNRPILGIYLTLDRGKWHPIKILNGFNGVTCGKILNKKQINQHSTLVVKDDIVYIKNGSSDVLFKKFHLPLILFFLYDKLFIFFYWQK